MFCIQVSSLLLHKSHTFHYFHNHYNEGELLLEKINILIIKSGNIVLMYSSKQHQKSNGAKMSGKSTLEKKLVAEDLGKINQTFFLKPSALVISKWNCPPPPNGHHQIEKALKSSCMQHHHPV